MRLKELLNRIESSPIMSAVAMTAIVHYNDWAKKNADKIIEQNDHSVIGAQAWLNAARELDDMVMEIAPLISDEELAALNEELSKW